MQWPPLFLDLHVLMSPATVTKLLTILDYSVVSLVFNIFFFIVLKFLLVLVFSSKVFIQYGCPLFFVHFSGIFTAPLTGLAYILHHWTTITGFQFFYFFMVNTYNCFHLCVDKGQSLNVKTAEDKMFGIGLLLLCLQ